MIDPDFLYESQQNRIKVENVEILIELFEKQPMKNQLNYSKFLQDLKRVMKLD